MGIDYREKHAAEWKETLAMAREDHEDLKSNLGKYLPPDNTDIMADFVRAEYEAESKDVLTKKAEFHRWVDSLKGRREDLGTVPCQVYIAMVGHSLKLLSSEIIDGMEGLELSHMPLSVIVRTAEKAHDENKVRHTYTSLDDLFMKLHSVKLPFPDPNAAPPRLSKKDTNPKDAVGVKKGRSFSSLSWHVMRLVGLGMLEGARKYGRHNYRVAGVRASIYFDATLEHLVSWWEGEDLDPDTRLSHVIKAICSLCVLADAEINGMLNDDRPPIRKTPEEIKTMAQKLVEEIFERTPNPVAAYTKND